MAFSKNDDILAMIQSSSSTASPSVGVEERFAFCFQRGIHATPATEVFGPKA